MIWSVSTHSDASADTNVEIHASPASIHEGFTQHLQVNCTVSHSQASEFHLLVSLILSKTATTDDNVYTDIADVTSVSPHSVDVKDAFGATSVSGQLGADNSGFISYQWDFPSRDVAGIYRCTAHGMDKTGHPLEITAVSQVQEKDVDIYMVIDKMRQLELSQGQLARELNATKVDLGDTKSELLKTKIELDLTKSELANTKVELNTTKTQLAAVSQSQVTPSHAAVPSTLSEMFNGHKYFLTRGVEWNIDVAAAVCHLYGGYLIEIDDQQEWEFVVSFFNKHRVPQGKTPDIFIGMTDEEHEGIWTYFHSGKNVTFTRWEHSQPDNGDSENCALFKVPEMTMFNDKCFDTGMKRLTMCEIES